LEGLHQESLPPDALVVSAVGGLSAPEFAAWNQSLRKPSELIPLDKPREQSEFEAQR
jgi:hypothetical protein